MSALRASVIVCDDVELHPELMELINRAATLAGVVHCPVATSHIGELADDVLVALGKDLGIQRRVARDEVWVQATVWTAAEGTTDLIITSAQDLHSRGWRTLCELAQAVRCRLWLVAAPLPTERGIRAALAEHAAAIVGRDAFNALWDERLAHVPAAVPDDETGSPFPAVPDADFTSFRATARELLDAGEFAVVDATFRTHRERALSWATETGEIDEEPVAEYVRATVARCQSTWEALTAIRAIQAAFFVHGWLLKVATERFLAARPQPEHGGYDEHTAARLRIFQSATYAAMAAVIVVSDRSIDDLTRMRMSDLDCEAQHFQVAERRHETPASLHGLLLAQRLWRLVRHGAAADTQLFAGEDGAEVAGAGHTQRLRRLARDSGLRLVPERSNMGPGERRWITRRGVSTNRL